MRSNSSLLWTLGFEIAYRLEIKDRGTGQCPDCFTIVFEIFEMIFLPIPVSRWSVNDHYNVNTILQAFTRLLFSNKEVYMLLLGARILHHAHSSTLISGAL